MFLPKIKKVLLLSGVFLILASCSEYQKVLKEAEPGEKYAMAEKLYTEALEEDSNSKFRKAIRLFEQIVPQYRGKPQGEKVTFLFADSYYHVGDNYLAGYQFERFVQAYPNSDRVEEAQFKSAKSYYYLSPRYDLDQTETVKAVAELQKYIDAYPNGEYLEEANNLAADLRVKLEKKAFEIAKQYHKIGDFGVRGENYKAAIVAFTNFINEYPGSPFREAAFYYRFDAAYQYAINSYEYLMKERLNTAREYYNNYKRFYSEGDEHFDAIQASFNDLESRLQNL
ncbi:outer membrane protein assembly factor BamD [Antarcticibacterium flavum]|uniref:Outer membrane protein assembly factor BamD n=1 Tax=Antarcticibacterium flavum TaxID=2058175 RepID=A0A5B7X576_9FLAO|nr:MULTISPECIES: outer membrane protein assembly factor BamD [Antarcticibacterium]MCM4161065.1 outer membrane protein assembly factor BamD [Antarcticibacterium sp. W02-3]QCY70509.1 outer membrane protein assembly factor BamD [Antarcticibacterium flavum]